MGRRSSAARSAPRPAPRPSPVRNPPQTAMRAAPPAHAPRNGGSALGGIGGAIVDGIGFGSGSAIAHRTVDALLGPRTIHHEVVAPSEQVTAATSPAPTSTGSLGSNACNLQSKAFQDCVNTNGTDISKCQFYLDMLNECRRGSSEMLRA